MSTTTQSITPSQNTVSYATLNTDLQSGGYASNFKNRVINGAMVISQRNGTSSVTITSDGQYVIDRWITRNSVTSKFSIQQNAGAVTPPAGFTNYLGVTSLSSYSVGTAELFCVGQRIEGFNTADLMWGTANAQPVTLSFWVRSSLTGTFGGSFLNSAENRSYPFTYTISSANTWEQKSITVVGDTTGTWLTTNGLGVQLFFNLGTGSTYTGTAGSWSGSQFFSATGATSVVGTSGATFYITGVQLEKGSTATSFDYRSIGTELALCQRYYEKSYNPDVVPATASDIGRIFSAGNVGATTSAYITCQVQFKVSKRATPTVIIYDTVGNAGKTTRVTAGIGSSTNSNGTINNAGTENVMVESTDGNSHSQIIFQYVSTAEL
jgi:hypothetical protein